MNADKILDYKLRFLEALLVVAGILITVQKLQELIIWEVLLVVTIIAYFIVVLQFDQDAIWLTLVSLVASGLAAYVLVRTTAIIGTPQPCWLQVLYGVGIAAGTFLILAPFRIKK